MAVHPPSTSKVCPVIKSAAGLARNTTAPTTSSGWPMRPSGIRFKRSFRSTGSSKVDCVRGVKMKVGATALTWILCRAHLLHFLIGKHRTGHRHTPYVRVVPCYPQEPVLPEAFPPWLGRSLVATTKNRRGNRTVWAEWRQDHNQKKPDVTPGEYRHNRNRNTLPVTSVFPRLRLRTSTFRRSVMVKPWERWFQTRYSAPCQESQGQDRAGRPIRKFLIAVRSQSDTHGHERRATQNCVRAWKNDRYFKRQAASLRSLPNR